MSNIIALCCKLLPIYLPICNQACREAMLQPSLVSMCSFKVVIAALNQPGKLTDLTLKINGSSRISVKNVPVYYGLGGTTTDIFVKSL